MAYFVHGITEWGSPTLALTYEPYQVSDIHNYAGTQLNPTLNPTGDFRRFGDSERIEQKVDGNWKPINWNINSMTDLNSFWNQVNSPGYKEYNALLNNPLGAAAAFDATDAQFNPEIQAMLSGLIAGGPTNNYFGPTVYSPGFNAGALAAAHLTPEQKLQQNSVSMKDPVTGEVKSYFIPKRLFDSVTYGNGLANETYGAPGDYSKLNEFGVTATLPGLGEGVFIDPSKVSGISSKEIARSYDLRDNGGSDLLSGLGMAAALFGGLGAFGGGLGGLLSGGSEFVPYGFELGGEGIGAAIGGSGTTAGAAALGSELGA